MVGTTGQDAGQFSGSTPFTGHNIQGHSVNARLVREVPAHVLRSSVTHFGTRGLFGKPVRRTAQHDNDNVRRKRWRAAQSVKPKAKLKPECRGHQGAPGDNARVQPPNSYFPGPVGTAVKRIARGLPPSPPPPSLPPPSAPHPSPQPRAVDHSSSPPHFAQVRSCAALPGLASGCKLPTLAAHENYVPPPASHLENTTPSVNASSHCCYVPASLGERCFEARYCPTVLSTEHSGTEEPLAPEILHAGLADASFSAQVAEVISNHRGTLREKPFYSPPSSSLGATFCARPLATSPNDEGGSRAYVHPSMSSRIDAPIQTRSVRNEYLETSAPSAHASYTSRISPCSPIAPSPPCDASLAQNHMHVVNGYFAPMWSSAEQERTGWGISLPQNVCNAYSASPCLAPAFNQYLGDDASTPVSTFAGNGLSSDLVDCYTGSPIIPYIDAAPLPNELAGSCGFGCASMNDPHDVWQTVPELHFVRAVDANININVNPSCLYPQSVSQARPTTRAPSAETPAWATPPSRGFHRSHP